MDDVERSGKHLPISNSARQNGDSERRKPGKARGNRQPSDAVGCPLRRRTCAIFVHRATGAFEY